MKDARYFSLPYRHEGEERYLIWILPSDDLRTSTCALLAVDKDGLILAFQDRLAVQRYASLFGYALEPEEQDHPLVDLDWVAEWYQSKETSVECFKAFYAWNLFDTVNSSLGGKQSSTSDAFSRTIYEKLYWSYTTRILPDFGAIYEPKWEGKEIQRLKTILGSGLSSFKSSVLLTRV